MPTTKQIKHESLKRTTLCPLSPYVQNQFGISIVHSNKLKNTLYKDEDKYCECPKCKNTKCSWYNKRCQHCKIKSTIQKGNILPNTINGCRDFKT